MSNIRVAAIVLAAGSGSRMGSGTKKQYMDLEGHPVLFYSIRAFQQSEYITDIVLVTAKEDIVSVEEEYKKLSFDKVRSVVAGGKERYNSVFEGLREVKNLFSDTLDECFVFIHDGARPFVDQDIISRCMQVVSVEKACVAAMPSKDTVKISDESGYVISTPDRRCVWTIQTPQCFEICLIFDAYSELIQKEQLGELGDLHITDDAQVCEHFTGKKIRLVEGSYKNIKITTPEDMQVGKAYLNGVK